MSLAGGLYTYLKAQTAITDVVGSRIHPLVLPQSPTYPAITYSIDGLSQRTTLDGVQQGIVRADIQIDAWADEGTGGHKQAHDLAVLILAALKNLKGSMGGVTVQSLTRDNQDDFYENTVDAYRNSISFTCWHTE